MENIAGIELNQLDFIAITEETRRRGGIRSYTRGQPTNRRPASIIIGFADGTNLRFIPTEDGGLYITRHTE